MKLLLRLCFIAGLIPLSTCKKYQPATPAFFITPGKTGVVVTPLQGSSSSKITDLWLDVNGQFQGVFPIENKMPIVSGGKAVVINVYAGIKNNGISDTRIFYPFFDYLTIDTMVASGKSISRNFTFTYKPSTTFTLTEDFDHVGSQFKKSDISADTAVRIIVAKNADSFENKSMQLLMSVNSAVGPGRIETFNSYGLPQGNANVYLELDYKCNTALEVGVIDDNSALQKAITLNPRADWNKIYIQLATAINNSPNSTGYKVYFQIFKADANSAPAAFLDNIKVLFL